MKGVYRTPWSYLLFTAGVLAAFVLAAVFLVIPEMVDPSVAGPPKWFLGIWIAFVIYAVLRALRTAYQIRIRPDGVLEKIAFHPRLDHRGLDRSFRLSAGGEEPALDFDRSGLSNRPAREIHGHRQADGQEQASNNQDGGEPLHRNGIFPSLQSENYRVGLKEGNRKA